jgi:hypothetical protein
MQSTTCALLLISIGALIMGCSREGKPSNGREEVATDKDEQIRVCVGDEELVLVPSSASQARAEAVLPSKGSEDVSHVLGKIDIPLLAAAKTKKKNTFRSRQSSGS